MGATPPVPATRFRPCRGTRSVDPLATPGQADLTQWADFPAVLAAAQAAGVTTAPLLTQAEFLTRLGLHVRADRLKAAQPEAAALIDRQVQRLTAPDRMGTLFKVVALHSPDALTLPAFEVEP